MVVVSFREALQEALYQCSGTSLRSVAPGRSLRGGAVHLGWKTGVQTLFADDMLKLVLAQTPHVRVEFWLDVQNPARDFWHDLDAGPLFWVAGDTTSLTLHTYLRLRETYGKIQTLV